jgi:hypothetical protein
MGVPHHQHHGSHHRGQLIMASADSSRATFVRAGLLSGSGARFAGDVGGRGQCDSGTWDGATQAGGGRQRGTHPVRPGVGEAIGKHGFSELGGALGRADREAFGRGSGNGRWLGAGGSGGRRAGGWAGERGTGGSAARPERWPMLRRRRARSFSKSRALPGAGGIRPIRRPSSATWARTPGSASTRRPKARAAGLMSSRRSRSRASATAAMS